MDDHTTEDHVSNVLRAGSVSGLILHETARKAREENGMADPDDAPAIGEGTGGGSGNMETVLENGNGAKATELSRGTSGLRQRSGHRNGGDNGDDKGKGNVDTGELEAHAVQSGR